MPDAFDAAKLHGRIDELAKLEDGWDSYGATALDPTAIQRAHDFVTALEPFASEILAPWIGPSSGGSVEILLDADEDGSRTIEIGAQPDCSPLGPYDMLDAWSAPGVDDVTDGLSLDRVVAEFVAFCRECFPRSTTMPDQPRPTGDGLDVTGLLLAQLDRGQADCEILALDSHPTLARLRLDTPRGILDCAGVAIVLARALSVHRGVPLPEIMRERQATGVEHYGDTLRLFNGRDVPKDAHEEACDLGQYLLQMALEALEASK